MSRLNFTEESGTPSAPSAGKMLLYPKTDKKWYTQDEDSLELTLIPEIGSSRTVWVDGARGNDSSGAVADINKPFATLQAAEAAITTATATNQFQILIAPGNYDVQGYTKCPNIHWIGAGNTWLNGNIVNIFTGDSSAFDLAHALIATQDNVTMFKSMTFACPISADFYGLDSVSNNHYGLVFTDVTTHSQCTVVGRGADHDSLIAQNANFDFGFDATSVNMRGVSVYASGNTFLRANNNRGAQFFTTGLVVLSPLTVQSVDNTSFCLLASVGSIGGGAITVDGAAAQLYMDASFPQSSLTATNGGTIVYVTQSQFINCTNPFVDSGGFASVDVEGRKLKNTDTDDVLDWSDADQKAKFSADVQVTLAGRGFAIKEGADCKMGLSTLVGGTVTVTNASVTAASRIQHSRQGLGGTAGFLDIANIIPGTSFDIVSTSVLDTSTVLWEIKEAL